METLRYDAICASPLGSLRIVANEQGISRVQFTAQDQPSDFTGTNELVEQCIHELDEYFGGNRTAFSFPLAPSGTKFELEVWNELSKLPYGETCSYLDIANHMNNPGAIRAVGRANGANPIAIVIPCHRVIGADGSLTGYGGGLWRKRWLLDHEARVAGRILL